MYITIGFSTTKTWRPIAAIIRKVENRPYSHVYLKFRSESLDRDLIYHASQDDINFMNMQMFLEKNVVIKEFVIPVTPEEKRAIMQYSIDRLGIPYGMIQLIGMGLVRITKMWFGIKIRNPWRDGEKTQVCLELVGRALKFLGVRADESLLEEGSLRGIYDLVAKVAAERQALE